MKKPRALKKKHGRLNLYIGIIMIGIVILAAIFAPYITNYHYAQADLTNRLAAPDGDHLFGTDFYGRDVYSKVIYGTRIALEVAGVSIAIQLVIGITVGLLSGYFGGWVDRGFCFIMDITWAIPPLIMAFAVIYIIGKSLINAIIAVSIVSWAQYARIVRTKTMSVKNMAFVETGVASGESVRALMTHYIMPNILPSVIVIASLSIPHAILSTTSLSFLGFGSVNPSPDWGLALSESMKYFGSAPWTAVFPGLALVFTTFGFTMLGEGLRDLLDPRMKS
ncbi:MAG: ABC transporter permease [Clostridia bacterium]|nr:ABC transporter permease [Clostridia bacterium]